MIARTKALVCAIAASALLLAGCDRPGGCSDDPVCDESSVKSRIEEIGVSVKGERLVIEKPSDDVYGSTVYLLFELDGDTVSEYCYEFYSTRSQYESAVEYYSAASVSEVYRLVDSDDDALMVKIKTVSVDYDGDIAALESKYSSGHYASQGYKIIK